LRLWATANYCRAGIKSLRGTRLFEKELKIRPDSWWAGQHPTLEDHQPGINMLKNVCFCVSLSKKLKY
jgi:hypothetical protein